MSTVNFPLHPGALLRMQFREFGLSVEDVAPEVGCCIAELEAILEERRPITQALAARFQNKYGFCTDGLLDAQDLFDHQGQTSAEAADGLLSSSANQLKSNRKIRDTVFTKLFQEPKNVLELYEALHPEDEDAVLSDIRINTIESIFSRGIYNDLSFIVRDKLIILVESQSTWCSNIALRMLAYYGKILNDEVVSGRKYNVYGKRPVKLQPPEFYVIYTGDGHENVEVLTLDEIFGPNASVQCKVAVLRKGEEGTILAEYIEFCRIYSENCLKFRPPILATEETLRMCLEQGILVDFVREHEQEVRKVLMTMFTQEQEDARQAYFAKQERDQAIAEAVAKAVAKAEAERDQMEMGRIDDMAAAICRLVKSANFTLEQAFALINAPRELQDRVRARV